MDLNTPISTDLAMQMALEQARQGLGRVSPNPPVGAVILKNGNLISQGFHKFYGGDHAEVVALKQIDDLESLKEAYLYVTLEPCSFHGQTPSCAQYLSQFPFKKIYVGVKDPNPKVNGKGIQMLKDQSISVELYQGKFNAELEELIEIFSHNMLHKKPFVSLKMASSMDGRITDGTHQWITGEESRNHVHLLRGYYDSICIGLETLITDNPKLNSRHPLFVDKKNKVILLDPLGKSIKFLDQSNLVSVRDPSDIFIFTNASIQSKQSYRIIRQKLNDDGLFDVDILLDTCFNLGIRSIFVEGGAKVFTSFFSKAQRLYLFLAPLFIGDQVSSVSWSQNLPIQDRLNLKKERWLSFGSDQLLTGRLDL